MAAKIKSGDLVKVIRGKDRGKEGTVKQVRKDDRLIGEGVQIGPDTKIYDHDHDYRVPGGIGAGKFVTAPVTIGDNSWIGCNVVILRGTSICKNCIVGAGSGLKGAYPAGSMIEQKRQTTATVYLQQERRSNDGA